MPRNASDDEGAPSTPKKTPNRAKNRQIVRWTDEKLAFAFTEFRLACQKHRIDVKKPLEDAAKAIAPFVTGDALVQQLSKRRIRYFEDHKEDEDLASRNLLPPSAKASPASPATGKTGTPKRRRTGLQLEVEQLNDTLSPSATTAAAAAAADIATAAIAGTPTSSAKRKPRATTKHGPKDLQEIKRELSQDSDSESEYTESPAKAKKKRVRSRKASNKKKNYADYEDEDFSHGDDEPHHAKEREEEQEQKLGCDDEEYVDEAGGTNVLIKVPSSSEPSPTGAKFPSFAGKSVGGKHYGGSHAMGGKYVAGYTPDPKAIAAVAAARREDSFADTTPTTSDMGSFVNAPAQNSFAVEDVFVDQNGQQRVEQNAMFMGGHGGSFNHLSGMSFDGFQQGGMMMNSFYGTPFNTDAMLANQLANPPIAQGQGQGHIHGQVQDNGNGHGHIHTTSNSNSDSSQDHKQASLQSSFAASNPSFWSSTPDMMQSFQATHRAVNGGLGLNFDDTPTSKSFLGQELGGFGLGL